MWHCPSCGAPQAESARCWVCRRSSTTCSTCTHFRRALAGDLGYCGIDPKRAPLTGLELRGCWVARPTADQGTTGIGRHEPARRLRRTPTRADPVSPAPASRARDFVPVESPSAEPKTARRAPTSGSASRAPEPPPAFVVEPEERWAERTSLFGEFGEPEG